MSAELPRIDHVYIQPADPAAVFDALTATAGLPIAWAYQGYPGGFSSGGVFFGNLILELVDFPGAGEGVGVALAPAPDTRTSLRALGQVLGEEMPFAVAGGPLLWTNTAIPSLSSPGVNVFLCEYAMDPATWWDRCRSELAANKGGSLGVESIVDVVLTSPTAADDLPVWRLLAGRDSPGVRLEPSERRTFDHLTVQATNPAASTILRNVLPSGETLPLRFVTA